MVFGATAGAPRWHALRPATRRKAWADDAGWHTGEWLSVGRSSSLAGFRRSPRCVQTGSVAGPSRRTPSQLEHGPARTPNAQFARQRQGLFQCSEATHGRPTRPGTVLGREKTKARISSDIGQGLPANHRQKGGQHFVALPCLVAKLVGSFDTAGHRQRSCVWWRVSVLSPMHGSVRLTEKRITIDSQRQPRVRRHEWPERADDIRR